MKKEEPKIPKQVVSLDLVHRLLELADQYHVHVVPTFRNELLRLQDRVIQAMNMVRAKQIESD